MWFSFGNRLANPAFGLEPKVRALRLNSLVHFLVIPAHHRVVRRGGLIWGYHPHMKPQIAPALVASLSGCAFNDIANPAFGLEAVDPGP